jgi:hypothetical protein
VEYKTSESIEGSNVLLCAVMLCGVGVVVVSRRGEAVWTVVFWSWMAALPKVLRVLQGSPVTPPCSLQTWPTRLGYATHWPVNYGRGVQK